MAIETILYCQVDQEPKAFCEDDIDGKTMSFAVNLSIDCRATTPDQFDADEAAARLVIEEFLTAVQTTTIAIYQVDGASPQLKHLKQAPTEVREPTHVGSPAELMGWLDEQKKAVSGDETETGSEKDRRRFWAPLAPPKQGETPETLARTAMAGAGDRLRSVQSWNAPVGHGLALTRIIRVAPDVVEKAGLVALPFLDGVTLPDTVAYTSPKGARPTDPIDVTYEPGFLIKDPAVCRVSPVPSTTTPLDLPGLGVADLTPEGYLITNPNAVEVHRCTRWFEQRAASLMATAAALGPRDATNKELDRVNDLCRLVPVADTDFTCAGAVWYGVSRLVATLDNLVLALVQPEQLDREGEILAPLVTAILDQLAGLKPPLPEDPLQPANLTDAIRKVFLDQSALVLSPSTKVPATEKSIARALRHVHVIPEKGAEKPTIVDDTDLVAELVTHFFEADPTAKVGSRLKGYATDGDPLKPKPKPTFGDAVTRAVSGFEQRLNDESGAEAAIVRLLETIAIPDPATPTTAPVHQQFAERFLKPLKTLDEATKANVRLAFERGWIAYRGLLDGPFNGAEAVRQASGGCFTRLLLAALKNNPKPSGDDFVGKLTGAEYFERRFLGLPAILNPADPVEVEKKTQCFDGLVRFLYTLPSSWRPDEADLRKHLSWSFVDAVEPIQELTKPQRFVPDPSPRPLPVQIAANIDGSKVEEFANYLNGMALAIRRLDTPDKKDALFAHAHLADLFWSWPSPPKDDPVPRVVGALHRMLPAVSDGRAPMFIEYEGYPFAAVMPGGVPVNNGYADADKTRLYYQAGPHRPVPPVKKDFPQLPRLAYGRRYETFAFVTSNAGTLPLALQRDTSKTPWMPLPLGGTCPQGASAVTVDYQRTTAIADMTIAEPERELALFGKAIDQVHPLAEDYPRAIVLATRGNTSHCDLFLSKGGFGEIAIPRHPPASTSQSVTVSDIRLGGQPKSVRIEIMDRLSNQPHVVARMTDAEKARDGLEAAPKIPCFDVPMKGQSSLTMTFRVVKSAEHAEAERFVDFEGVPHPIPTTYATTCWIRLVVEANDTADVCLSFAEVEGSASAAAGGPLLLLCPEPGGSAWRRDLRNERTVTVSTPRVTYTDFERWYANPAHAGELSDPLRYALLVANMLRHADKDLAQLIDRLPDPAVTAVRIDFAMIDSLGAADPDPGSLPLDISKWFENFNDHFKKSESDLRTEKGDPTPWTVKILVGQLKKLDELFRFEVKFKAGPKFSLDRPEKDKPHFIAQAQEGSVTRLTLHAHVEMKHFPKKGSKPDDHPAMFDGRLLQYARVIDKGTIAAFQGASLRLEVMADAMAELSANNAAMAIEVAEAMIAVEPVERVRRYDLATVPAKATGPTRARWRLLSEVEVATQRWRPSGRPLYNYVRPREQTDIGWIDKNPNAIAWPLRLDEVLARFEHEAFFDRPHFDAHTTTQRLKPLPARTVLQSFPWEAPSATYFRHRFTLRSRYAGALHRRESRECAAWPPEVSTKPGKGPPSMAWAKSWTKRVVMLADVARVLVTRPQLRALLPLTTAPDQDGRNRPAPPVAAILQEPPFAHGGLADRIAAEIKTGFGYGFDRNQPTDGDNDPIPPVQILDSRKEAGPLPHLTYTPLKAESALGLTLVAEGAIGLTFDDVNAPAPAFPNAMLTLRPTMWFGDEPPLEDLMMGVAMRRYIDPHWTTASPVAVTKADGLPVERAWLVTIDPKPRAEADVPVSVEVVTPTGRYPLLWLKCVGTHVSVRASKQLIDGVDTKSEPVEIARFERDRAETIHVLHQPVTPGRHCAALLASPASSGIGEGASNLPVILTSLEWSLPQEKSKGEGASTTVGARLHVDSNLSPTAYETIASAQTFLRWTRTGRDFDFIHVAEKSDDGWTQATEPVRGLMASVTDGKLSIGRGQPTNHVWPCSSTFTSAFPLHVHRHVAVITTRLLRELGRSVERYGGSAASGLRQPTLVRSTGDAGEGEGACRIIEYETPAAILCDWTKSVPDTYKTAYFDLFSTGFNPAVDGAGLRLFLRIVAPFVHTSSLKTVKLSLWTSPSPLDPKAPTVPAFSIPIPPKAGVIVGLQVTIAAAKKAVPPTPVNPEFAFLTASGDRILLPPGSVTGGTPIALSAATADRPGLYVQISGDSAQELWTDVSLLHSAGDMAGEPFDFDWLFSPTDDANPAETVGSAALNAMVEAQARIIAVSPPIPIA